MNTPRKKKTENLSATQNFVRFFPSSSEGLSSAQVAQRKSQKLTNATKIKTSKSYASIFAKNIFTFFNFLWLLIAIALIAVQAYRDLIFLVVITLNTVFAIIQEIRAKITVEKLSIVAAPKVKVIRDGQEIEIASTDLVLDDIIVLSNGDQVPTDCVIIEGKVEVNESLLTGESNALGRTENEPLLSGSFLVSGLCYARVEKVGKDNYVYQMAQRAREFKAPQSNLFRDLNRFIRYISIALVPIGVLTFLTKFMQPDSVLTEVVRKTAAVLVSMIPAGMYLLITLSLAVGVIKLAKKKTLVKDIYSIEMLARTNVLCLDKTGTITDGTMEVKDFVTFGEKSQSSVKKLLSGILNNQKATNATSLALIKTFGKDEKQKAANVIEFSSDRKYSVTQLAKNKIYFLGAVTRIGCALTKEQKAYINEKTSQGLRVIALSELEGKFSENISGKNSTLLALIALEDHIRKDVIETISWFKENGVEIKIISGDDPATVAKIAQRVGVENSDKYVSLENYSVEEVAKMANEYTVFGRVTPEQKYTLVKALKDAGKVVAMTGDGVNDTLALKEADCSIAMADGSEVARGVSKLVLLNSDFTALPSVVKEGRQVINNVQNSSGLFVMKTLFAILLSLVCIVSNIDYPFVTYNMFLLESLVIGIPSFVLAFEPNSSQIKGEFIVQVLKKSLPRALLLFVNVFTVVLLHERGLLSTAEFETLAVLTLTLTGYINLCSLCIPMTKVRAATCGLSICLIALALLVIGSFFIRAPFYSLTVILTILIICVFSAILLLLLWVFRKQIRKLKHLWANYLLKD